MEVRPVDPRDTMSEWKPTFRVYFYKAMTSYEFVITGANLDECLEWIRRNRDGRPYTLFVEVPTHNPPEEPGLLLLDGIDGDPFGLDPSDSQAENPRHKTHAGPYAADRLRPG
jgi:hypothetical protein